MHEAHILKAERKPLLRSTRGLLNSKCLSWFIPTLNAHLATAPGAARLSTRGSRESQQVPHNKKNSKFVVVVVVAAAAAAAVAVGVSVAVVAATAAVA